MRRFTIYLVGKMGGLSFEEYNGWRAKLINLFNEMISMSGKSVELDIINPAEFYNYSQRKHQSEKEIMEFELGEVRKVDIVIANLEQINSSVGSIMELATAKENRIPVIGYTQIDINIEETHPWIKETLLRIENNCTVLFEYINTYFIR